MSIAVADALPAGSDSLVAAKISVPGLPAWLVRRRRLDTLLSAGRPVTVVTGPPGAGKTVAIASWLQAAGPPAAAWLSADRYDNQPASFWRHVAAAIRAAGVAAPLPVGPAPASPDFPGQLAAAVARHERQVVLVLDDLHLVTSRAVLDDVAYLARRAAGRLRLVIAARGEQQLPLHQFLLSGELTSIGSNELAFTTEEARSLLARHHVELSEPALATVLGRTEGWAAGLRLAAIAMQDSDDPDKVAAEFGTGDGPMVSYLLREVLDAQPARTREVLLKTSILDQVSDDLAMELTGDRQAGPALSALADANSFVQSLRPGWYRYCPVFAQALRIRLQRAPGRDPGDLRRRAARWLRQRGDLPGAVAQAAAASDWSLAARMIVGELAMGQLADPVAGAGLAAALSGMPGSVLSDPPRMITAAALAAHERRTAAAEVLLDAASVILAQRSGPDQRRIRVAAAQVRLALAQQAADAGATASAAADVAQRMAALPDGALRLAELPAGFGGSRRGGDGSGEEAGVPVLIERLSRREHEVLELMSGMLTTAEIAGELYLSPNTVKSHVRSILRKLGASRRGEAVRRARELRLLRS